MHAISFQLKRAHLRTVAFGQELVGKIDGMTPARFDLLCLLRQASLHRAVGDSRELPFKVGMSQRELWQRLDLCRTTVSKMLTRLEEMGWIRRRRHSRQKRTKLVLFTPLGLRQTWCAMRTIFRGRPLLKYFEDMMRLWRPKRPVVDALFETWDGIDFIAACFGDRSDIRYDFGLRQDHDEDLPRRERMPFYPFFRPPPRRPKPTPRERWEGVRPIEF